jgi:hypothetical protein
MATVSAFPGTAHRRHRWNAFAAGLAISALLMSVAGPVAATGQAAPVRWLAASHGNPQAA